MPFGFPDITGFYDMLYGTAGVDLQTLTCWFFGNASGVVFNNNPPYTVTDFLGFYPKFFGPASNFSGLTVTTGSAIISGFADAPTVSTMTSGMLIVNPSFPKDTLITSVDPTALTVTVSNIATANGSTLTVYETPFIPIIALLTYVNLAHYCVMITRYFATWQFMMALFVAHYATLYMRTESGPNDNPSQVASSGLTKGIITTRAAGDVSAGAQATMAANGYEDWGAWGETQYGEQFITIAKATNCGPVWVP